MPSVSPLPEMPANTPASGLRVLAVIPGIGEGASFGFARKQVSRLLESGVNVRVIFLQSQTSPVMLLAAIRRIRSAISDFQPHILHAHYGTMTSFVCAVSSALPLVITFRGSDLNRDAQVSWLRSAAGILLSQLSCLRSTQIICVSRQLADRLWLRRKSTVVLTDGIDLSAFQPISKPHARSILGWEQDERVVLINGGDRRRAKGVDFVDSALRVAERAVGPIRLVILDGSVTSDQMPLYYNGADLLAVASLREGSPNVVKEAVACNLPVVSTDVGDVKDRLSGVHPSAIVERDPLVFGRAVADILSLGTRSNGKEHSRDFDDVHLAQCIKSLYESIRKSPTHGAQELIELRSAKGL